MFLSMNGLYNISLRPDNCMCNACYRDCLRGEGKPRWFKLAQRLVTKHCIMNCLDSLSCSCDGIIEWGPSSWCGNDSTTDMLQWG